MIITMVLAAGTFWFLGYPVIALCLMSCALGWDLRGDASDASVAQGDPRLDDAVIAQLRARSSRLADNATRSVELLNSMRRRPS